MVLISAKNSVPLSWPAR